METSLRRWMRPAGLKVVGSEGGKGGATAREAAETGSEAQVTVVVCRSSDRTSQSSNTCPSIRAPRKQLGRCFVDIDCRFHTSIGRPPCTRRCAPDLSTRSRRRSSAARGSPHRCAPPCCSDCQFPCTSRCSRLLPGDTSCKDTCATPDHQVRGGQLRNPEVGNSKTALRVVRCAPCAGFVCPAVRFARRLGIRAARPSAVALPTLPPREVSGPHDSEKQEPRHVSCCLSAPHSLDESGLLSLGFWDR
jgi:hypothetical protein